MSRFFMAAAGAPPRIRAQIRSWSSARRRTRPVRRRQQRRSHASAGTTSSSASSACWRTGRRSPSFTISTTDPFDSSRRRLYSVRLDRRALQRPPKDGRHDCWRLEPANSFEDYLNSDCVWIQMWVELPDASTRERMQAYLDGYWAEQRKAGRFQRPRKNRLTQCRPMAGGSAMWSARTTTRARRPGVCLPGGLSDQHGGTAAGEVS